MSDTNDTKEEQAFPTTRDTRYGPTHIDGMTLLDYFAAKAMEGSLASDTEDWNVGADSRAATAYEVASAMMEERERIR